MRILVLALLAFAFPVVAQAADDFGQRFGNSAPSALADDVKPEDLQAIAPAAGTETTADQAAIEKAIDPVIEAGPEVTPIEETPAATEDTPTPAN